MSRRERWRRPLPERDGGLRWVGLADKAGRIAEQQIVPFGGAPADRFAAGWRKVVLLPKRGDLMIQEFDHGQGAWVENEGLAAALRKRVLREGLTLDDALDRIEALEAAVAALRGQSHSMEENGHGT